MLNATNYLRHANQNHIEVPHHSGQNVYRQKAYKQ